VSGSVGKPLIRGFRTPGQSDRDFRQGLRPVFATDPVSISSIRNHLFSVIAGEWPIDGRHANLADFCGLDRRACRMVPLLHERFTLSAVDFEAAWRGRLSRCGLIVDRAVGASKLNSSEMTQPVDRILRDFPCRSPIGNNLVSLHCPARAV
jgi:hypothetical protein